jgi:thiosulfate reductase cytochrome b subunit
MVIAAGRVRIATARVSLLGSDRWRAIRMRDPNVRVSHGRQLVYRHSAITRVTHWVNVVCVILLLMSGLQIFNATPALYWGIRSSFDAPVVSIGAEDRGDTTIGVTKILGHSIETTGVLGVSNVEGQPTERAFPAWITIPSYQDLATGRRWHFFFAWLLVLNGAVYLLYALFSRHLWRDLVPSGRQLRQIGRSIVDHALLRFHRERDYNVLQKLSYFGIVVIVLPLLVLAGLTMSPGLDTAFPWLLDLFGGRQTARTIHFAMAALLVLFVLVHVVMVLVSGVWNNLRSMVTGRYAIEEGTADDRHAEA